MNRAIDTGRRSVFVYYTLAADRTARLRQAASLLASLSAPWRFELMCRAVEDDPGSAAPAVAVQTWMEVYTLDDAERRGPAALRQLIEARAREAGVVGLIDGERHYEVFEACA